MSDFRYVEEEITRLAYPATLPAPVKRLLASKYLELRLAHHVSVNDVATTETVGINDLPPDQQDVVNRYVIAKKAFYALEKELKALPGHLFVYEGTVQRDRNPEIVAREKAQQQERLRELTAMRDENRRVFSRLVREIADAALKPVKVKLPEDLLRRLETLGSVTRPALEEMNHAGSDR
jgi:hypothetical protein